MRFVINDFTLPLLVRMPLTESDDIPSTSAMIDTKTLAQNIIKRHNTSSEVLDARELSMLRRFCLDPSSRETILRDEGMLDAPGMPPGTVAVRNRGSLVGHCIARHGTDDPALSDEEVDALRDWFNTKELPSVREMINTHTLAQSIINRPWDFFEPEPMAMLRRFCLNWESRDAIMEEKGMKDEPGMVPGTMAQTKGSLIGFCVASYGTDKEAMTEKEWMMLREWFKNGGPGSPPE